MWGGLTSSHLSHTLYMRDNTRANAHGERGAVCNIAASGYSSNLPKDMTYVNSSTLPCKKLFTAPPSF